MAIAEGVRIIFQDQLVSVEKRGNIEFGLDVLVDVSIDVFVVVVCDGLVDIQKNKSIPRRFEYVIDATTDDGVAVAAFGGFGPFCNKFPIGVK